MIQCPYCETSMRSNSALSSHLRLLHTDHWRGSVKKSIPEGFDVGLPEAKKYRRRMLAANHITIRRTPKRAYVRKVKPVEAKAKTRSHIDFCPSCGANIKAFELAAGFMQ